MGDRVVCRIKSQGTALGLTMLRSEEELAQIGAARVRVPATVTGIKPFGAFVELGGFSGLLHRSEMELLPGQPIPWTIGDEVRVRLLNAPNEKIAVPSKALFLRPSLPRRLVESDADLARLRCFHSKETF